MTQFLNVFPDSTLVDILQYRATHQPDNCAFIFLQDGETQAVNLTYKELDRQARAIAFHLQSVNAVGSRALLLYPPGLEFIAAFLGCLYAKVIAVPAYPPRRNQKINRLQAIVKDAEATLCLTTASELDNIRNKFIQDPQLAGLQYLATDSLIENNLIDWHKPIIDKSTLAFLQYTSGSTGKPKGVMVSHGNLIHNSYYIQQACELTSKSISVTWLPSFHDMGLVDGILQPLYTGFLGVVMSPTSFLGKPVRWLQAISDYKATHCGGPNFAYELCINKISSEQIKNIDLSSWRSAYNGAEPIRRDTLKRFVEKFQVCGFRENSFYPCYGMAETTLMVSGNSVKDKPVYCSVAADSLFLNRVEKVSEKAENKINLVGCGHECLDTKIAIANPQTLASCAKNEVGEIWVSSDSVAQGYWKKPELTKETFQAYLSDTNQGPFLRTGDLGFLRDGELFVTGRIKDVIIIRGRNHYPQDIELTVEKSHPALRVTCSAAFTVEVDGEERLVIAQEVERVYLRKLKVDEVLGAIRKAVSEQHQLQVYAVLLLRTGSIPKTSSGKIQRHACKIGFTENNLQVVGNWISQSSTIQSQSDDNSADSIQKWIKQWLSGKLQISSNLIDTQKSFAEYGLDSVMAVELAQDLKSKFNPEKELEATIAWNFPNIDSLVLYLSKPIDTSSIAASNFNSNNLITTSSQQLKQVSGDEVKTAISHEVAQIEDLLAELESLQRSN
ncbi:AMP-binding protein [Rivularia sp. PCC 7116]|uniref:AMP-binding protein n=1 Tax=Rivularia sp. PCC 7116 TaxID=373994 RepID=UPI0012FA4C27|nr:AMP-binding protein [Rivularia sp. PCC 7116]